MSYAMQPVACHDVMVINHYFTKSVQDTRALRFVPRLRALLA
jgi:hypothetical protein